MYLIVCNCLQSNQRNYQCSMCGKQFLRSISLNTHMKYHLNLKTKQCPHCPMVFVETKNLTRHLKTHVRLNVWRAFQSDLTENCVVHYRL